MIMATYRRGFKAEADAYARNLRAEMQLRAIDPLCPWKLADHLGISIINLSSLRSWAPMEVTYLLTHGAELFFAVTVFGGRHGQRRTICLNDANKKTRQAADLAHELSHALLGHPATEAFSTDSRAEEEARWMGPALLVSSEAAWHLAKLQIPTSVAASRYGVSERLLDMRLNVTGARKRLLG